MMKFLMIPFFLVFVQSITGQQLQLHYDFRHSIDPALNRANFPSLSFEYFQGKTAGSFLFKMQADFNGEKNNAGQLFLQVSKTVKFWKPKIYLSLNYSGGHGVAPPAYGYYLTNTFAVGSAYPFSWKGAWLSANLQYRYTAFARPSHDPQLTFYFGKGYFNYKIFIAGSWVAWTENKDPNGAEKSKKFAFFGDPQIWIKLKGTVSIGTRVNLFYRVLTLRNKIQVYPTIGIKNQF